MVMRYGSLNRQFDPELPLLDEYNALAFQALVAEYIQECLRQGKPIGDEDAIRLQLGIHIDGDCITFALPIPFRSFPPPDRLRTAEMINHRYQPRRGWLWGSSCVEDILRRSTESLGPETAETSGFPQRPPPAAVVVVDRGCSPIGQCPSTNPRIGCEVEVEVVHPPASASPPVPDRSIAFTSLQISTSTPRAREERAGSDVWNTPMARRHSGSGALLSHPSAPFLSPTALECAADIQVDIDDDPFEMPQPPGLDAEELETTNGTVQMHRTSESTPAPHESGPLPAASSPSSAAVKVIPCSRCHTRGYPCKAPSTETGRRTKRPACLQCARSHTTCDMRIVTESDEKEYQKVLGYLDEIEEAFDHDVPVDISPHFRMLEAATKLLQEAEW